jgi:hypothetical protein
MGRWGERQVVNGPRVKLGVVYDELEEQKLSEGSINRAPPGLRWLADRRAQAVAGAGGIEARLSLAGTSPELASFGELATVPGRVGTTIIQPEMPNMWAAV